MENKIIIIGAGGHGKVVLDAILAQNKYNIIGFIDDGLEIGSTVVNNYKIIANSNDLEKLKIIADNFIVAIGDNRIRARIYNKLKRILNAAIVIHPKAIVASGTSIMPGSVVLAGAVISVSCKLGENTIINSGVIVDHESEIGSHAHLSIGTIVGCNSHLPDYHKTNIGEIIPIFSVIK